MATYSLVYIPSEQHRTLIIGKSLSGLITVSSIEDAEKLLAAEYYTAYAIKCERNIKNTGNPSFVREQYQDEFNAMTKQFLDETPKEFLRLNNFEVIEIR